MRDAELKSLAKTFIDTAKESGEIELNSVIVQVDGTMDEDTVNDFETELKAQAREAGLTMFMTVSDRFAFILKEKGKEVLTRNGRAVVRVS